MWLPGGGRRNTGQVEKATTPTHGLMFAGNPQYLKNTTLNLNDTHGESQIPSLQHNLQFHLNILRYSRPHVCRESRILISMTLDHMVLKSESELELMLFCFISRVGVLFCFSRAQLHVLRQSTISQLTLYRAGVLVIAGKGHLLDC